MWRAFFLAVGIFLVILGIEFLVIEKAVLAESTAQQASQRFNATSGGMVRTRDFKPPEWLPWTLLSAGAVVIIYSFTIPKRVAAPENKG